MLYEKQFGFREKHSTAHATSYLASEIYSALNDCEKSICIFMDLSKAFDTLDLNILLAKLKHYGIIGKSNDWFSSYLTNRSQYVEIDGHTSYNVCNIMHGVPQGSILGLYCSMYMLTISMNA